MLGIGIGLSLMGNPAATSVGGGASTATWNASNGNTVADWTLSNGNLTMTRTANTSFHAALRTTTAKASGTIIVTVAAIGTGGSASVGIGLDTGIETQSPGVDNGGHSCGYLGDGSIRFAGSTIIAGASYTTGDVIKIVKAGAVITFYKNNVSQGSIDTSSATYGLGTVMTGTCYGMGYNSNSTGASLTLDATGW